VNVIVMQVFVSLMLVAGSIVLFVHSVRQRDHEHADRLSLAPLEDDALQVSAQESALKERACRRDGSSTTTP
jgi:hypothetical protein